MSMLAALVSSGAGLADSEPDAAVDLSIECRLVDSQTVVVGLTPTTSGGDYPVPELDLIVDRVDFEARSKSGGFWVQLPQPVTARLEFDLCAALDKDGIELQDLDAVRILVMGKVLDGETTTNVGTRCGHFPPPHCLPIQ